MGATDAFESTFLHVKYKNQAWENLTCGSGSLLLKAAY
jgi:hypothetical protein